MRQLNGVYTQASNGRHRRVGHLFQGCYKAILMDKDSHLLELSRYGTSRGLALNMQKKLFKGPGADRSFRSAPGEGGTGDSQLNAIIQDLTPIYLLFKTPCYSRPPVIQDPLCNPLRNGKSQMGPSTE